jgi:hypothetical protein
MTDSKNYLNVPYAEKDQAKALGARWDASRKKWYVPDNIDISAFAKWQTETNTSELSLTTNKPKPRTPASINSDTSTTEFAGVTTYPSIKDFVAYNGDEPPWE